MALLVASSALAAVLLYRYVNVPAIGPLPAMYEPAGFLEKSLSAAAEAMGAIVDVGLGCRTIQAFRHTNPGGGTGRAAGRRPRS